MAKDILVVIPVNEKHRKMLEEIAVPYEANLVFKNSSEITETDLSAANALIGNLPPGRLKEYKQLEWVQLNSAGAAEYAIAGILPETCILTNAAGAYGIAVSEHMLAMTFSLIRRFGQYSRNQLEHRWESMGNIISIEGSTIAVLGMGDIGGRYAEKVKALGAYVIGFRRTEKEKPAYLDEQYTLDVLDKILPRADIVAMVLPDAPSTRNLMNDELLAKMKQGSFLINVGRGSAVDLDALEQHLLTGHLGGAGLDVTEPEPLPAQSALWDFDNVIITPHVAGNYFLQETFERIVRISAHNLAVYLAESSGGDAGLQFTHVVDRKTGY